MVRQITPRDLALHLANGRPLRLIDVRQPWENQLAALPDCILIPMADLPQRASELDPKDGPPLILFCHHGIRSLNAGQFLERIGFQNVFSLAGGIDAWSCEVDPTVPRY